MHARAKLHSKAKAYYSTRFSRSFCLNLLYSLFYVFIHSNQQTPKSQLCLFSFFIMHLLYYIYLAYLMYSVLFPRMSQHFEGGGALSHTNSSTLHNS